MSRREPEPPPGWAGDLTRTPRSLRGFTLELPPGFVDLPTREDAGVDERGIADELEQRFRLPRGDPHAAEMAQWFSVVGRTAAVGGMEFAALGFFHSPDDLGRPVYVLITGTRIAARYDSPGEAITGMQGLFEGQGNTSTQTVQLRAGPALLVTTERARSVPAHDHDDIALVQREVTAWVPDSTGSVLGAVSVSSASWPDWAHVCDLALQVFDSVSWEET